MPTLYVLTALRSRAANTIAQHLVGLQVLLLWCRSARISLEDRVDSGTLFRAYELDALWDAAARPIAHFRQEPAARSQRSRNVVGFDQTTPSLGQDTVGNRRRAIRRYLAWLSERRLFALGHQPDAQKTYRDARDELLRSLDARSARHGRSGDPRQGLDDAERRALLDAIDPGSEANPWKEAAVRQRNLLMIMLLLQLGLRRGELLALRVEDIDLQRGQVRLIRRPDDKRDSRKRQPVLKTQGRLLDLRSDLADLVSTYILHSDTQNAKVYVEATSDIIDRLDKALALKLAPLAQAFTGHFISAEELRKAPGGVVRGGAQAPPLGACGQQAFCGFAAPIACYTCRQFRPWRDGPHAAVLERLIRERERLQSTTDSRIASVNDRTILAVAEVVRLCEEGANIEE
ncbi:tyrosine-type recombinase/integrase [Phenylobacterium sp. NIBR 498073]|uniref:tyrosine-type recombinase/integrase n=1 Tax=Phenylobacterium sp. NIBR 498073 TaxID=3015177 RepID=UPI0022B5AF6D|nr:tyrosine-type recombinase/integrase [Phenylobacterium sp. NIBR 498073]WGU38234.1 tyrosine-type recombinase/integrase [Phenylobacterium sp. NIBR 498073]